MELQKKKKALNSVKVNVLVDSIVFLVILVSMAPHTTGESIHEWVGIAAAGTVIVHLLLHWKWIVGVTKRFFKQLGKQNGLNYIVNVLFFINLTVVIFTGLMISKTALPAIGIQLGEAQSLKMLHKLTSEWIVYLVGVHVALHWKWILNVIKRYLVQPVGKLFQRPSRGFVPAVNNIVLEGEK